MIADAWMWIPFIFIVLVAALDTVSKDLVEAADVDGAGKFLIFKDVIWPQIAPVAGTVVLIRWIEGFKLVDIKGNSETSINNSCNAVIIETKVENKNLSKKIKIPKIFIQEKPQKGVSKNPFEAILKLPINIIEFNQTVVDLCKKYEFEKNSLVILSSATILKSIMAMRLFVLNLFADMAASQI